MKLTSGTLNKRQQHNCLFEKDGLWIVHESKKKRVSAQMAAWRTLIYRTDEVYNFLFFVSLAASKSTSDSRD